MSVCIDSPSASGGAQARSGAEHPLVVATGLGRDFDVSKPWLNRLLEREGRQILRAVDDVSFTIARGETLGLVGESGCGKSTVARLIVGLYAPSRGSIAIDGVMIEAHSANNVVQREARRRMQMIFQDPYASLNPRWRVNDVIAEPLVAQGRSGRLGRDAIQARVGELLRQVGLGPDDGRKYPHEFSGGQRQRISIARALSSNPQFLVCDEPTSALDVSVQAQILNLMKQLQRSLGLTYLFISHNLAVISHVADRTGVMYLGRLVELAPTRALFARPRHPYTRMLIDAIPDMRMTGAARTPVTGEVPNPLSPPSGCAFHPRCPLAVARCRSEVPDLRDVAPGVRVACHEAAQ